MRRFGSWISFLSTVNSATPICLIFRSPDSGYLRLMVAYRLWVFISVDRYVERSAFVLLELTVCHQRVRRDARDEAAI
jgi:hypothetical protein